MSNLETGWAIPLGVVESAASMYGNQRSLETKSAICHLTKKEGTTKKKFHNTSLSQVYMTIMAALHSDTRDLRSRVNLSN